MLVKKRKIDHNFTNDNYFTGYKYFDESLFGKPSQERLRSQPDYRANIIWPLYTDIIKRLI